MSIVGKIEYVTSVDTSGLDSGLKKSESTVGNFANKVGSGMAKVGKVVGAALTATAAGATALAKSAVESYGEYEQLVGGVETLFKDSSGKVMEYAANAYKTAGLSANAYMTTVTGFSASLLQSLGGDTAKAAEYANRAVTDMADNANKMGTNIESLQWAYQGFAKQNYTMLDNLELGYGGTKEEMARLIEDASKLTEVQKELGVTVDANDMSFGNIVNAISVVQKQMGIMGTTSKEASDTIQGSISSMKGAWENLVTGMADPNADLGVLMNNFVQSVGTVAKNVIPALKTALSGIGQVVKELAPIIVQELPGLIDELLPAIIEAGGTLLNGIISVLPQLLTTLITGFVNYLPSFIQQIIAIVPQLMAGIVQVITVICQQLPTIIPQLFQGVMQVVQGIIQMLPQILPLLTQMVLDIVTMLTQPENLQMILEAGIQLLMSLVEAIPQILIALVDALPQIINNIVNFLLDPNNLQMIINGAIQLFLGLVKAVPQILSSLVAAFGTLVGNLWNNIVQFFQNFASDFGNTIGGIFRNAINGVLGFIENFINGPIDLINSFVGMVNSALGGIGVNIGYIPRVSLPRLASGGIVPATNGGQMIIAGEGGEDEWVVPESKMASLIEQLEAGTTQQAPVFNINFNGIIGTKSELRKCAIEFHDAYMEVERARMQ